MKSIWNGAIGFGLVNIPVKMYSAIEESNIDLDMVDKKDLQKIKYKRVNEKTGAEVEWENIGRAFDYEGNYILIDDEDFENVNPEKSKIFSIDQFVDESELDSIYFENSYFLEPQKNGESAYSLMLRALKETGKIGIGSFILRAREILGVLKVYKDILLLQRIRFTEEVRDPAELKIKLKESKPAELKMAVSLIEQMAAPIDITNMKDNYSKKLMEVIKTKAKGGKIAAPKPSADGKSAEDIMALLKASLEAPATKKK